MAHPHRLWLLDFLYILRAICALAAVIITAVFFANTDTLISNGPDFEITPVFPSYKVFAAIHFSVHGFLFVNDLSLFVHSSRPDLEA
jgi:hypothetical protein